MTIIVIIIIVIVFHTAPGRAARRAGFRGRGFPPRRLVASWLFDRNVSGFPFEVLWYDPSSFGIRGCQSESGGWPKASHATLRKDARSPRTA